MKQARLVEISRELSRAVSAFSFSEPVTHVYNPLEYAASAHEEYLTRFGAKPKKYVLMGMNPGPWGMAQTGVPFGDVVTVKEWLRITEKIDRPEQEHPKRPVLGLECPRVEVSGTRLWSWARDEFSTPERFFANFLVINYCPLVFMEESGRNRTPDRLPVEEKSQLIEVCDASLRETIAHLAPQWLIGVGKFARKRAEIALAGCDIKIGDILHPSPASPAANRGWREKMTEQLSKMGIKV